MRLHSGAAKHTPHSVGPLLYCLLSAQPITKFKHAAITLFLLLSSDLASVCTTQFFLSFQTERPLKKDVDRGVLLTDDVANILKSPTLSFSHLYWGNSVMSVTYYWSKWWKLVWQVWRFLPLPVVNRRGKKRTTIKEASLAVKHTRHMLWKKPNKWLL